MQLVPFTLLIYLYQATVYFLSVPTALVFLFRKRARRKLWQRFGLWKKFPKHEAIIWLHAASVGEVQGLTPVFKFLKDKYPENKLLLTSTSITGLERGQVYVDYLRLLPFDSLPFYRSAFKSTKVKLCIISETEIWPGMLRFNKIRSIETILINGRLSPKGLASYKKFSSFICKLLDYISIIAVSSQTDKQRFIELGISSDKLLLAGNSKYDQAPSLNQEKRNDFRRQVLGDYQGPVLVLGSIRQGEEQLWLSAIAKEGLSIKIFIVPRHQERFEAIASMLQAHKLKFDRYSQTQFAGKESITLVDSMGLLEPLYSLASIAFIGGTLVPIGGHSPLEAMAYGVSPILGPYVDNITEVVESLESSKACLRVNNEDDCKELLKTLSENQSESNPFAEQGSRAKEVYLSLTGAMKVLGGVVGRALDTST